jgi:hypothetical protein
MTENPTLHLVAQMLSLSPKGEQNVFKKTTQSQIEPAY